MVLQAAVGSLGLKPRRINFEAAEPEVFQRTLGRQSPRRGLATLVNASTLASIPLRFNFIPFNLPEERDEKISPVFSNSQSVCARGRSIALGLLAAAIESWHNL